DGDGPGRPAAGTTAAWAAIEQAVIGKAVDLLSGPGGLASFLRRRQLGVRLSGPSLPLDIGYAETIPAGIRNAVMLRDKHCQCAGRCAQPAEACQVHHTRHKADGGPTSVKDCVLLCWFHHQVAIQCRCLSAANYRGMECEYLGGHPAGRAADLACCAEGVLLGRALEAPVGFAQAPDAGVELAADLRGHRRHELLDLHSCLCRLTDDAAPHVLADLDEGDAVRVDPLLAGQPYDDPGQAVMHRQVRPYLLADQ